jgi:hypothetical protein
MMVVVAAGEAVGWVPEMVLVGERMAGTRCGARMLGILRTEIVDLVSTDNI